MLCVVFRRAARETASIESLCEKFVFICLSFTLRQKACCLGNKQQEQDPELRWVRAQLIIHQENKVPTCDPIVQPMQMLAFRYGPSSLFCNERSKLKRSCAHEGLGLAQQRQPLAVGPDGPLGRRFYFLHCFTFSSFFFAQKFLIVLLFS